MQNKLKTIRKIICVIFCVLILITAFDYFICLKFRFDYTKNRDKQITKLYPPIPYIKSYMSQYGIYTLNKEKNSPGFFKDFNIKYNWAYQDKKPIIIFGCSFAYGAMLNEEQKIHTKLSKLLKRNIYNFGQCGAGIQFMYSLLNTEDFFKQIKGYYIHIYS